MARNINNSKQKENKRKEGIFNQIRGIPPISLYKTTARYDHNIQRINNNNFQLIIINQKSLESKKKEKSL